MAKRYPYVECRALGHSWDQLEDDTRNRPQFGAALQFRCVRCHTVRRDVVSTVTGDLLYRSYSKPDDYSVDNSYGRNDWRLALMAQRKRRPRAVKPQLKVVNGS
jgi:hypothetical protein